MTKKVKFFERLKGKSDIDAVYKKGKTIISTDKKLKAFLLSSEGRINKIRVAITVSSKAGNSVWRNRFKRIIRESIRQEKEFLKDRININKQELSIIFSPYRLNQGNFDQVFLKDIKPAVTDILNKITKSIIKS
ncbi:MAG TPA: ribonuclease P protein component [Ignavibacteriaceae bacterium]|nr:ribonuclease P protein component [Ignavibacteriaceae bacterium]